MIDTRVLDAGIALAQVTDTLAGVDVTAVLVALIGAMGIIGVALVQQGVATARRAKRAELTAATVADRVGEPNGEGNVVRMLERLLRGQTGQDSRLARLEMSGNLRDQRLHRIEQHLGLDDLTDPSH